MILHQSCWIRNKGVGDGLHFPIVINYSCEWLVIYHTEIEQVQDLVALGEQDCVRCVDDVDAKEILGRE